MQRLFSYSEIKDLSNLVTDNWFTSLLFSFVNSNQHFLWTVQIIYFHDAWDQDIHSDSFSLFAPKESTRLHSLKKYCTFLTSRDSAECRPISMPKLLLVASLMESKPGISELSSFFFKLLTITKTNIYMCVCVCVCVWTHTHTHSCFLAPSWWIDELHCVYLYRHDHPSTWWKGRIKERYEMGKS